MARPLGYLIFSLLALIRDPIFQRVLGANPGFLFEGSGFMRQSLRWRV